VVVALLGLPAAWLSVPGFKEWVEGLGEKKVAVSGDPVIDSQSRKLEELKKGTPPPTESQLAEALAPLFTRPAFYRGIREEDWRTFLYVLCRTRLLLEEYEGDFKNSATVRMHIDSAIMRMVALQNEVATIYGPNFRISEHIRRYVDNEEKFLNELPKVREDPTPQFFDARDREIASIRSDLQDAGLVDKVLPAAPQPVGERPKAVAGASKVMAENLTTPSVNEKRTSTPTTSARKDYQPPTEELAKPAFDQFTSDPAKPRAGEPVTLHWSVRNADRVTLQPFGVALEPTGMRSFTACGDSDISLDATSGTESARKSIAVETPKEAAGMRYGDDSLVTAARPFKIGLFSPFSGMAAAFDPRNGTIGLIDERMWRVQPQRRQFELEGSEGGFRIVPEASDFKGFYLVVKGTELTLRKPPSSNNCERDWFMKAATFVPRAREYRNSDNVQNVTPPPNFWLRLESKLRGGYYVLLDEGGPRLSQEPTSLDATPAFRKSSAIVIALDSQAEMMFKSLHR
jgi:hypothetical protein